MVIYLENDGEKIPVSVGFYALKRYEQEQQKPFSEISDDDLKAIEPLFWYSMEAGYKKEKKKNPWKREDCELLLDDLLYQFIEAIPRFFPGDQVAEEAAPKKGAKPRKK